MSRLQTPLYPTRPGTAAPEDVDPYVAALMNRPNLQMNKSHHIFGNTETDHVSVTRENFVKYDPQIDYGNRPNSTDLLASHFKLGNHPSEQQYLTTTWNAYNPQPQENIQPSRPTTSTHHAHARIYPPDQSDFTTTASVSFRPPTAVSSDLPRIRPSTEGRELGNLLRDSHFELGAWNPGNERNPEFATSTTTKMNYPPPPPTAFEKIYTPPPMAHNHSNVYNYYAASNMDFETEGDRFRTSQGESFLPSAIDDVAHKGRVMRQKPDQETHFHYAGKPDERFNHTTLARQQYIKPIGAERARLAHQMNASSVFKKLPDNGPVTTMQNDAYQDPRIKEMQQQYGERPVTAPTSELGNFVAASHFEIGGTSAWNNKTPQEQYQTIVSSEYSREKLRTPPTNTGPVPPNRPGTTPPGHRVPISTSPQYKRLSYPVQRGNINFGNDHLDYETSTRKQYPPNKAERAQAANPQLAQHHFAFGTDPSENAFHTTQKETFAHPPKDSFNQERATDPSLYRSSIPVGITPDGERFQSTSRNVYVKSSVPPTVPSRINDIAKSMKTGNVVLGTMDNQQQKALLSASSYNAEYMRPTNSRQQRS